MGLLEQGFCTAKEEGDADGAGAGERGSFQEAEGTVSFLFPVPPLHHHEMLQLCML